MRTVLRCAVACAFVALCPNAWAAPVWVGDFETNDTSQWSGELNGDHISIVESPVIQGGRSARIELTNDAVWPNGLKRVELNHSPSDGRTAEGADTFFAWSFYVPETLPEDPSQQIGYWESDQSYQQMMHFAVEGERIRFITQQPQYAVHWEEDGRVTPAEWHRIAMHVHWSKDGGSGTVDVWFDGEQVVTGARAETLADDNPHFTQVGLLRGAIEFADTPVLFIDDAVEGDTLEDVRPNLPRSEGGGGAGSGGAPSSGGGAEGGNGSTNGGGDANGGAPGSGGGASGGSAADGDGSGEEGGCDCRTSSQSGGFPAMFGLCLGLWALVLRKRPR